MLKLPHHLGGRVILNAKKQINKMGVKKAENKAKKETPKKKVSKVYTCISCLRNVIAEELPTTCPCHNGIFAINKTLEVVGE